MRYYKNKTNQREKQQQNDLINPTTKNFWIWKKSLSKLGNHI